VGDQINRRARGSCPKPQRSNLLLSPKTNHGLGEARLGPVALPTLIRALRIVLHGATLARSKTKAPVSCTLPTEAQADRYRKAAVAGDPKVDHAFDAGPKLGDGAWRPSLIVVSAEDADREPRKVCGISDQEHRAGTRVRGERREHVVDLEVPIGREHDASRGRAELGKGCCR
jgi:hypothetical protein